MLTSVSPASRKNQSLVLENLNELQLADDRGWVEVFLVEAWPEGKLGGGQISNTEQDRIREETEGIRKLVQSMGQTALGRADLGGSDR